MRICILLSCALALFSAQALTIHRSFVNGYPAQVARAAQEQAPGSVVLTGFDSSSGGRDGTHFTYRVDKGKVRIHFEAVDATPWAVPKFTYKRDLESGDRVEIYFSSSKDISKGYYCAEIDPLGRVLDYKMDGIGKFNYTWAFKTLKTKGAWTKAGYQVDATIDVSELESLGIDPNTCWLGAFRADFKKGGEWVAWCSAVSMKGEKPNFHKPGMLFQLSRPLTAP